MAIAMVKIFGGGGGGGGGGGLSVMEISHLVQVVGGGGGQSLPPNYGRGCVRA